MNLIKRLFGSGTPKPYEDKHGIYVYVHNQRCDAYVRLRIDRRHDLNRTAEGFVWHKTVVDAKCFDKLAVVMTFDAKYNILKQEISSPGAFVDQATYERATAPSSAPDSEDSSGGGSAGFS